MNTYIEKGKWIPIPCTNFITKKDSVTDFSNLLDAPAGKYGRVIAIGDHFFFERHKGKPVRFNGTNLCFTANYLNKETTDKVVEEFARTGFNVLRIHHHDNLLAAKTGKDSTVLDPEYLDMLEYLIAACKKRGIYITTDLYVSRQVKEGEFPHLPWPLTLAQYKYLTMIDDGIFHNLAAFATNWLTHKNPYTGMSLAEDPVLIGINCVNEDFAWMWGADDLIRNIYLKRFEKYAAEKKLTVKQDINDTMWVDIIAELYRDFQEKIFGVVRKTGYKGLLTDLNWGANLWFDAFRQNFDYADTHFYHNHPSFPVTKWKMPAYVNPVSALKTKPFSFAEIAPGRLFGKPYTVTEWNSVFPHEGYADGAAIAGALYSFQDYSMLCRFTWSLTKDEFEKDGNTIKFFSSAVDPIRRLSERISNALFLRGDVSPAKVCLTLMMNDQKASTKKRNYTDECVRMMFLSDLAFAGKMGTVYEDGSIPDNTVMIFRDKADMPKDKQKIKNISLESARTRLSRLLPDNVIRKNGQDILTSPGGVLTLDRGKGIFKVVTPRSEVFILSQKGQSAEGNFVLVKTNGCYVNFFISAKDGHPLADSKRILLLHLTKCGNTGLKFKGKNGLFYDWGNAPVLMQKNTLTLTLKTSSPATLFACGLDGTRIAPVEPVRHTAEGFPVFHLRNSLHGQPIAVYELIR